MVKVLILFTAGTNCDQETKVAFEEVGAQPEIVHMNTLKIGDKNLKDYQILVIPGGFTYGDYIAAGRILANELRIYLREDIEEFTKTGKLILGICNGFQVLVKAGILPGFDNYFTPQIATLDFNDSNRFEDRWVYLKTNNTECVFTKGIEGIISLPVAHAEGKFLTRDKETLDRIKKNSQIVFEYVNEKGEKAGYPYNPNGSVENIAGICDPTGKVLGLMPHPERFVRITQHPKWHTSNIKKPDGLLIFQNSVDYVKKNL